jgi:hypothetical protein
MTADALADILRGVHVVAGGLALLLGPVILWAPKRPGLHPRLGEIFFWLVTAVTFSGGALGILFWETRWMFVFIALGTFAFAVLGYVAGRRRWRRWLLAHVIGQGSAYTAMVTAFVVANWDDLTGVEGTETPLVFLVPMFVGTVAVAWLVREVAAGRRPAALRS